MTGPINDPSPGGPGRSLAAKMRAVRAAAAARAGTLGRSAEPLTERHRVANYRAQTGRLAKRAHRDPSSKFWWLRDDLTPKQRRRAEKKANRAKKFAEVRSA